MTSGIWAIPELEAMLRRMWEEGHSCSQIAAAINDVHGTKFTRNAVIGAVHRKMLPVRHKPPGLEPKPRKPKRRPKPKLIVTPMPTIEPPAPPPVADQAIPLEQRKTLMELQEGDCRWPIGDPQEPSFFFCGATAVEGHPYCAGHCARAYDRAFYVRRPFIPLRPLLTALAGGRLTTQTNG